MQIFFYSLLLTFSLSLQARDLVLRNLNWPVELTQWPYQFGPGLAHYQNFATRYFHGGQDILVTAGQPVFTPVAGRIEAGFYSYKDGPDGHSHKTFVSFADYRLGQSPPWGKKFFEITVINEQGYRFEFHHVDPESLSEDLRGKILNKGVVEPGEWVGNVISMGSIHYGVEYDHIHYNIVSPKGRYLNPFYFSVPVLDREAPEVGQIFSGPKGGCGLRRGEFYHAETREAVVVRGEFLLIKTSDIITGNIIPQIPTYIRVQFGNQSDFTYDFSYSLYKNDVPLDIRNIYQEEFCVGTPEFPVPVGGSSFNKFYFKIPVPQKFVGKATVEVEDFYGNKKSKTFQIVDP